MEGGGGGGSRTAICGDGDGRSGHVVVRFHFHDSAQLCTGGGDVFLDVPDVGDTHTAPGLEANGTPDAESDEAWSPVPAVLESRSTGEWREGLVKDATHLGVVGTRVVTVR